MPSSTQTIWFDFSASPLLPGLLPLSEASKGRFLKHFLIFLRVLAVCILSEFLYTDGTLCRSR